LAEPTRTDQAALTDELARLRRRVEELEGAKLKQEALARELAEDLEGERSFRETLLDSMREAIYITEAEGFRIFFANRTFLKEYELSSGEVVGLPCYRLNNHQDSPCPPQTGRCPSRRALETGQAVIAELIIPQADAEPSFIEYSTLPVPDQSGRPRWLLHVERDITERKEAEARLQAANRELRRSNAFLRNLIMSSVDAVIAADMTGRILIFTKAAGQITGYTEAEALEKLDIRDIYPGDGAREIMRRLRSDDYGLRGQLQSDDVELLCKDGSTVPIRLSAAIVYEDEVEVATVGFFYDLREKRRMEQELDKTRIQLLQAEKMASLGKLAAGVAHQLNNPLGGITIFGHLLLEDYPLEPEVRADIQRILEDAERCQKIVKELLQFARQTDDLARPCEVNETLLRTVFFLENQPLFHNIAIDKELAPSLPGVSADPHQLSQAFMNIILNAVDAMEGQGRLTLKTQPYPGGEGVVVEISDTGPGIPEEAMPFIFDPFFTTKEEGKGTGLGLSVAFGIIENCQGRITARNDPRGGATFRIELPRFREPEAGTADDR